MNQEDTTDQRIVDFLSQNTEAGTATLKIAKEIHGPKASCRLINPTLYRLQTEGKLRKVTDDGGTNPRWFVVNDPQPGPI